MKPIDENVRADLFHSIHSLAPIYDVDEFNMKTGHSITEKEYDATIKFLNVDTKEETLQKCRAMAEKTYEQLIHAKRVYCESKNLYGVIPGMEK